MSTLSGGSSHARLMPSLTPYFDRQLLTKRMVEIALDRFEELRRVKSENCGACGGFAGAPVGSGCFPPTKVCGGRPPPGQTFFGHRGWVHRSVRLSCRWKAEQVSPTFPRGATRRSLAPSATYRGCGCRMAQ